MPDLNRTKLESVIRQTRGKFFQVSFTKKDGSQRRMHCQLPTPKKDAKRSSNAKQSNSYILVTDIELYKKSIKSGLSGKLAKDKAYRLINLATITELVSNGVTWSVVD